ncbi:hypothetical protein EMCRGX_G020971 [Ephydatia muelleri]
MARCSRSRTTVQKVKVQKWLTLKEKMKVVDEVKRAAYARLIAIGAVYDRDVSNRLNCCFPHLNRYCMAQQSSCLAHPNR